MSRSLSLALLVGCCVALTDGHAAALQTRSHIVFTPINDGAANVYLDGRLLAMVGEFEFTADVAPGSHRVVAQRRGCPDFVQSVSVPADGSVRIVVRFRNCTPVAAIVVIRGVPQDATFMVDESQITFRRAGQQHVYETTRFERARISFLHPRYARQEIDLELANGDSVIVTLDPGPPTPNMNTDVMLRPLPPAPQLDLLQPPTRPTLPDTQEVGDMSTIANSWSASRRSTGEALVIGGLIVGAGATIGAILGSNEESCGRDEKTGKPFSQGECAGIAGILSLLVAVPVAIVIHKKPRDLIPRDVRLRRCSASQYCNNEQAAQRRVQELERDHITFPERFRTWEERGAQTEGENSDRRRRHTVRLEEYRAEVDSLEKVNAEIRANLESNAEVRAAWLERVSSIRRPPRVQRLSRT